MTDLKGELASLQDRPRRPGAAAPGAGRSCCFVPVRPRPAACSTRFACAQAFSAPEVETATARASPQRRGRGRGHADPDRLRLRRGAPQGGRLGQDPGPPRRAARRGGQPRARGRADRPAGERRLRGAGAARRGRRAARARPTWPRPSGSSGWPRTSRARAACWLGPARRRREPREDRRRPRSRRPARTSASPRPSSRTRASARRSRGVVVKKMAEVGESVAPIPPGREPLDLVGRDRGPGRSRHARGGGRRRGVERRQARDRPAGRGHGRGVPGPASTRRSSAR